MSKPLALMDVDGVLNPFGIKPSDVETAPNIWPVPKMGFDVHAGVFQFYQIFWHTNLPRIIGRLTLCGPLRGTMTLTISGWIKWGWSMTKLRSLGL